MAEYLPVLGAVSLVVVMLLAVGYCLMAIEADDRRAETPRG
jgi:hypothetical protein